MTNCNAKRRREKKWREKIENLGPGDLSKMTTSINDLHQSTDLGFL